MEYEDCWWIFYLWKVLPWHLWAGFPAESVSELPQEAQTSLFRYHWNLKQVKDWLYCGDPISFSHPKAAPSRWDQRPLYRVVGGSSLHLFRGWIPFTSPFLCHFSQAPEPLKHWFELPWHLISMTSFPFPSARDFIFLMKLLENCKDRQNTAWNHNNQVLWLSHGTLLGKKRGLVVYQNITLKINQVSNEIPIGTNWCGIFSCMVWLPWSFSVSTSWVYFWVFIALFVDYLVKKQHFRKCHHVPCAALMSAEEIRSRKSQKMNESLGSK